MKMTNDRLQGIKRKNNDVQCLKRNTEFGDLNTTNFYVRIVYCGDYI